MAKQKQKQAKTKPSLENVNDTHGGGLARALSSSEYHTREAGLQAMCTYLSKKADIGEYELIRVWKAIFFCFWHSDKVPVQTSLAERLSEMMLQVPEQVGILYFKAFIRTMRREWFGIDHLRLDKYLMLTRKFYTQHLKYLQSTGWDEKKMKDWSSYWQNEVLLPTDNLVASGFAYHTLDLVLPQMEALISSGDLKPLKDNTLRLLLQPFVTTLGATTDKAMLHRLQHGLFIPLVEAVADNQAVVKHLDAAKLAQDLFDLGANKQTSAANRQLLYSLSSDFEKAAKKKSKSSDKKQQKLEPMPTGNGHAVVNEQQNESAEKKHGTPGTSKKNKKRKATDSEGTPAQPVATVTEPTPATNGVQQPSTSSKKSKKTPTETTTAPQHQKQPTPASAKQPKQQAQQTHKGTPQQQQQGGDLESPSKKNVRFSLKNNLVMRIGGPVPNVETRTPPSSKPKGPAIKRASLLGLGSSAGEGSGQRNSQQQQRSGVTPGSSGKKNKNKGKATPNSLPRPKAAQFF